MSRQIKYTHTHTIYLTPDTWQPIYLTPEPQFSLVTPLLQFIPTASCNGILPLITCFGDNHQSTGGWWERTQGQVKMAAWNSFNYICTWALHSFLSNAYYHAASTITPLLLKATFTPTIQPNLVSFIPTLHLLSPSTPFWPYSTPLFFPHAQTISVLSDPPYLLTPFLFQHSCAPLHY